MPHEFECPPELGDSAYALLAAPLVGQELRLSPMSLAHVAELHTAFGDRDLWTWQGRQPESLAQTRMWVESALSQASQSCGEAPFVIHTLEGQLAGTTRYLDIRLSDSAVEIGWTMVFAPFRRTRLNTAAKYLLLGRAFDETGCGRVQLKTDALNLRSRAAIERIGAKFEGILRCHKRRANGTLRDTAFFSITYHEWPGVKKRLESFLSI